MREVVEDIGFCLALGEGEARVGEVAEHLLDVRVDPAGEGLRSHCLHIHPVVGPSDPGNPGSPTCEMGPQGPLPHVHPEDETGQPQCFTDPGLFLPHANRAGRHT